MCTDRWKIIPAVPSKNTASPTIAVTRNSTPVSTSPATGPAQVIHAQPQAGRKRYSSNIQRFFEIANRADIFDRIKISFTQT